jgi:hypothetical protein
MRSIGNLFTAFTKLAASINTLAGVVDVATVRLRQQLALDEAAPALTHGEILDAEDSRPTKRNSKARAAVLSTRGKEERQSPPEGPGK